MLKIISAGIWRTILRKAKGSTYRRAAIAYVTDPARLPLRAGDVLVTDASNASIAAGRTSAAALKKYYESGVLLYNLPNLHAKVLVLDDWAVVGSANASQHSALVYFEAAVLSDRPALTGQAEKLVTFLAKEGEPVGQAFIKRSLAIPVTRVPRAPAGPRTKRRANPPLEHKSWLVSLHGGVTYRGDQQVVDRVNKGVLKEFGARGAVADWFIWSGNTKFREGDEIVECWRPRAKIPTTKSVRVHKHGHVRKIFQEPGVKTRTVHCVWGAGYGESAVSWSAFLRLAKHAGITRKLSYSRIVELTTEQSSALLEIWPRAPAVIGTPGKR